MISWPGPGVRLWRALHYLRVCVGLSSRALFIHRGNKVMNNQLTIYILTNRLHVRVRHCASAPPRSARLGIEFAPLTMDYDCLGDTYNVELCRWLWIGKLWCGGGGGGGGGVTTYHIVYYISISMFPRDNSINKGKFSGNVEFWVATACYWF